MMIRLHTLIPKNNLIPQSRFFTISINRYNKASEKFPSTLKPDNDETIKINNDVQQRISKILADIPQGGRIVEEPHHKLNSEKKPEPTFPTSDNIDLKVDELLKSKKDFDKNSNNEFDSNNKSDNRSNAYTYSDIFNIKQIIDTVKESENVKQLQKELTTFYQTKMKDQQQLKDSLSERVGNNVVELKRSIKIASKVVNEITGYNKVIKLKDIIVENEQKLKDIKNDIHNAKIDHEKALELRSSSQKEVNELLERKNSWNPVDLDRFTRIYMTTHDLDKTVKDSAEKLKKLEDLQESTHDALIRSIMNRYHEEQIWSDKIRQFSTWGTILIMCINLLLVLLVQFVFEPFKRWRLVNSFEGKVKELFHNSEKLDLDIQDLKEQLNMLNAKSIKALEIATITPDTKSDKPNKIHKEEPDVKESGEVIKQDLDISTNNELPPFRILYDRNLDTITLKKYIIHYYTIFNNWLQQFIGFMTPLTFKNNEPLNTTIGEFQSYIGGSVLISTVIGIIMGHIVI